MSQGTSGDQMWMDYGQPKKDPDLHAYADDVAKVAYQAHQRITYHDWVPLAMAETRLVLARRVPDPARLAWARKIATKMKDGTKERLPANLPEVYAREAIFLHEEPRRELKLQAVRIGELGITAISNEVFAITGLKIKARSPFETTMNIELANGSEGYIPPPEQHALGGYTTWPARTAGLEVQAEPKIVATVINLLEEVAGKPRHESHVQRSPYSQAILASRPFRYWQLDELQRPTARDSSANRRHATYEDGVAFFLPGPDLSGLATGSRTSRAAHFAGGRVKAGLNGVGTAYTVELWFWNGLPHDTRPITGFIVAREAAGSSHTPADQLGIGGTQIAPHRLFFTNGGENGRILAGKTEIVPKSWHHVALVRNRSRVTVYLDGNTQPEITGDLTPTPAGEPTSLFIGGRCDDVGRLEGKISEVALFDRALPAQEIAAHHRAADPR
jgi:hypothetical protein